METDTAANEIQMVRVCGWMDGCDVLRCQRGMNVILDKEISGVSVGVNMSIGMIQDKTW